MTSTEVVKAGKLIHEFSIFEAYSGSVMVDKFIIMLVLFIISLVTLIGILKIGASSLQGIGLALISMFLVFIIPVGFILDYDEAKESYTEKLKTEWIHNYANPYLNSLSVRETSIKSLDLSNNKVSFISNSKVVTKIIDDKVVVTDKSEERVEYVFLKENLGNGVNKGEYRVTVYIAE